MAASSRSVYPASRILKNMSLSTHSVRKSSSVLSLQLSRSVNSFHTNQLSSLNHWRPVTGYPYRYIPVCFTSTSSPPQPPQAPPPSKWAIVRLVQWGSTLTEKILYRISPKLHGLYKQFIDGGKAFILDVRFVYQLRGRMRRENIQLQDLPWKDIYIKDKVTRDMGKVIPTMIVTWLPFAFYVMLPLIFTFPRQFLSDHFLNKEQLSEFQRKSLIQKYEQERRIWELLRKERVGLESEPGSGEKTDAIKGCEHLNVQDVMEYRAIFEGQLRLENLPRSHLVSLCKLHSLLTLLLPSSLLRRRLEGKCSVLQAIDFALRRDGRENLGEQDLKKLCYQRVFPTYEIPDGTMQSFLHSWLETTAVLRDSEKTLYLHLPLFKKDTASKDD